MKSKALYVCGVCGATSNKWLGRCLDCNTFGSVNQEVAGSGKNSSVGTIIKPTSLHDAGSHSEIRVRTNISELDRILGGGLVLGSVILLGGEPGIGKSTLLLQIIAAVTTANIKSLYITGEESIEQVKMRAKRLSLDTQQLYAISATKLEDIIQTIDHIKDLQFVVIDSIQTLYCDDVSSAAGTVSQVKVCAQEITNFCKMRNIIVVIVGHVTKDGQIAGPKVLEHMVDTVLYFESDQQYCLRILRAMKNRFGSVNELGVFEMTRFGLKEVQNPSELFMSKRENNLPGSVVFPAVEGSRPFLIEIQALLAQSNIPTPRRSVIGWDVNRLSMILAVLAVRCKINLMQHEVYLNVAGGFKINETAADLAVCAVLISGALGKSLAPDSVFFGEVSLSGEIRPVSQIDMRIAESKKLGFTKIIACDSPQTTVRMGHITDLRKFIANMN